MKRLPATDRAPHPVGPYSQAVESGVFVFLSGQLALDPVSEQLVSGSAEEQTRQALRNIGAVLNAAGLSFADVVKTNLYLADIADYEQANTAYAEVFAEHRPARTTVAVARLPRGSLVEIDAIALRHFRI